VGLSIRERREERGGQRGGERGTERRREGERERRGCPQTRVYRGVPPLPLA